MTNGINYRSWEDLHSRTPGDLLRGPGVSPNGASTKPKIYVVPADHAPVIWSRLDRLQQFHNPEFLGIPFHSWFLYQ